MKIAIATFDGFNEIDSIVAAHILNRVPKVRWKAEIAAPTETVASMNGIIVSAQRPLEFLTEADVVIFDQATKKDTVGQIEMNHPAPKRRTPPC